MNEIINTAAIERDELLVQLSRIAESLGRPGCRRIIAATVSLTAQTEYIVDAVETLSRNYHELVEELDHLKAVRAIERAES